jgi:hypothetical protein
MEETRYAIYILAIEDTEPTMVLASSSRPVTFTTTMRLLPVDFSVSWAGARNPNRPQPNQPQPQLLSRPQQQSHPPYHIQLLLLLLKPLCLLPHPLQVVRCQPSRGTSEPSLPNAKPAKILHGIGSTKSPSTVPIVYRMANIIWQHLPLLLWPQGPRLRLHLLLERPLSSLRLHR